MPYAVGLERNGETLLTPFCPPYYESMTHAVRAVADLKFREGSGVFRGHPAGTAWADSGRVTGAIQPVSERAITATCAYCEYLWQRYGRFPVYLTRTEPCSAFRPAIWMRISMTPFTGRTPSRRLNERILSAKLAGKFWSALMLVAPPENRSRARGQLIAPPMPPGDRQPSAQPTGCTHLSNSFRRVPSQHPRDENHRDPVGVHRRANRRSGCRNPPGRHWYGPGNGHPAQVFRAVRRNRDPVGARAA